MKPETSKGKVCLVGAGPGSPDLITLKGIRRLQQAEVVIYDRLVSPRLLGYVPQEAEIIYAGKSSHRHILKQDKINRLLVKKAKQGKMVIRLKCGDPFLFGRGAEEALFLAKHKIAFEVVPGVSSATAVPAYAGIPLTHRNYTSSVGIFTGHEDPAKEDTHKPEGNGAASASRSHIYWEKIATGLGTLVFLMGVENLKVIVENLIKYGKVKTTPCCLIQQGTLPWQKSVFADLGSIVKEAKKQDILPPAILVAGDIVSLRRRLNWFESKPLFGKRIFITRQLEAVSENRLLKLLEDYGASCSEMPILEIRPLKNYKALDATIKRIQDFHWVIFTSQNGVKFFKQRLVYLKQDARILKGIKIAAIGPRTKMALEAIGLTADLVPKKFCQEGLIESFKKINLKRKNILMVRAKEARDVLPNGLRSMGVKVKIAHAYRTARNYPRLSGRQGLQDIDVITFTSASCVRNFFQIFSGRDFKKLIKNPLLASIGPITSGQLKRLGLKPDIQAKSYTFEGLTQAIVQYYKKRKSKGNLCEHTIRKFLPEACKELRRANAAGDKRKASK